MASSVTATVNDVDVIMILMFNNLCRMFYNVMISWLVASGGQTVIESLLFQTQFGVCVRTFTVTDQLILRDLHFAFILTWLIYPSSFFTGHLVTSDAAH